MLKKFKNVIMLAFAGSALFAPVLVPAIASAAATDLFAANNTINSAVCSGVNQAANNSTVTDCGTNGTGNGAPDITNIATKVINILSVIVGAIAVIMIIWGGFKYITSGGDTGNVSGAKNTLIFAIVGLIIVALAQFIVHFVLNTANSSVPTQ